MARPKRFDYQKMIKLDADMNGRLSDFRFASRFKTESEAIRELMRLGLTTLQEREIAA